MGCLAAIGTLKARSRSKLRSIYDDTCQKHEVPVLSNLSLFVCAALSLLVCRASIFAFSYQFGLCWLRKCSDDCCWGFELFCFSPLTPHLKLPQCRYLGGAVFTAPVLIEATCRCRDSCGACGNVHDIRESNHRIGVNIFWEPCLVRSSCWYHVYGDQFFVHIRDFGMGGPLIHRTRRFWILFGFLVLPLPFWGSGVVWK